jgi:hypothetical protein
LPKSLIVVININLARLCFFFKVRRLVPVVTEVLALE